MYLDNWMIFVVVVAFGICHLISRRQGMYDGVVGTLRGLHHQKIISIDTNGIVSRYKTIEEPIRKRRRKNVNL